MNKNNNLQGTPKEAIASQTTIGDEASLLQQIKSTNNSGTIRQSQMAFATDIAQGLINEVRKLQQAIQEKDQLIADLEISKADNEKYNELSQKQLRQKNTIEEKLKEDNWNLEMANQELQSNLSDLNQTITKLNGDHTKALKQLRTALEQVEIYKAQQEKAASTIDAIKARHDHERQVLRRNNGTLQRDMVQLKKRMDEVNTELKICKSKLAIKSTVSNSSNQHLLRGNNEDEHSNGDGADLNKQATIGTGGDIPTLDSASSNTAANTQRALEIETLKQSLGHAHRMITSLRNNLQKEKVEKIELKKVLSDTQDTLDQLEKGATHHEPGRGSLKKNSGAIKTKVVRKRVGVARKGHSIDRATTETRSTEDQSNLLSIHTTLAVDDYNSDIMQSLVNHNDLESGDDAISTGDSNSLTQDSDDDDCHRLDLSPIQQGQSLDMELQLGGFNSSFKPLSFELEETLVKRQCFDKGVNTSTDLASTLSSDQQTTTNNEGTFTGNEYASDSGNNISGSGNYPTGAVDITNDTYINDVSGPLGLRSDVSLSNNVTLSQHTLDLGHSPVPSTGCISGNSQQINQQPILCGGNTFDNTISPNNGMTTPVPGSSPLDQQNSHTVPSIKSPISDKNALPTDRQDDVNQDSISLIIPVINNTVSYTKHHNVETPHIIQSQAALIINEDNSTNESVASTKDTNHNISSTPINDSTLHINQTIDDCQTSNTSSANQQNDTPLSQVNEGNMNAEQIDLNTVDTLMVSVNYPKGGSHGDSTLAKFGELGHETNMDKKDGSTDQDTNTKDNQVHMDKIILKNLNVAGKHNQADISSVVLDLEKGNINDTDDITERTQKAGENSPVPNSALLTTTTYNSLDIDDDDNKGDGINDNGGIMTMETSGMVSREEADALIKAAIADALAKERLEVATRRQELDDNFITRSEAEAMAREQTEQAIKKERDRASTLLAKTQLGTVARTNAKATSQDDQQKHQSQDDIPRASSTYQTSSFLVKAQTVSSASRRESQPSVAPSPKPSTSTSSTVTASSASSSSSRLNRLSGYMKLQPSASMPAKSNQLRPSASMSSLRRTTTKSSSLLQQQQYYNQVEQKHQQPSPKPSYGSVRITEKSLYSKQLSAPSLKLNRLKQPSMQSLSSERCGMTPSLFSMGDLSKQGANGDLISAITQTMIGEWMWKHTRKHVGGGISLNKHKRFFWVHPYTRTLYWSTNEPGATADEAKAKSAFIESISSIPSNDTMDASPLSLLIKTAKRDLKLTAPTLERHELWRMSLSYLLVPPGEESPMDDVIQVDPYRGNNATTISVGSTLTRTTSNITSITNVISSDLETNTIIPLSHPNQPGDDNHQPETNHGEDSNAINNVGLCSDNQDASIRTTH
ncbi:hypothetical protein BC941DRAFT_421387 [Chlamydoabsidia padenii]|nr:hypothetical protein BC941DRAFT_421387 [Chlamydoabsidia padenii]